MRIVDRKKDMILVSGFNVYPNEVEDVVASHPGVLECGVRRRARREFRRGGQGVRGAQGPGADGGALMDFCREQLTGYKRPRYIEFRSELPKTNVGKILRRELRDDEGAVDQVYARAGEGRSDTAGLLEMGGSIDGVRSDQFSSRR